MTDSSFAIVSDMAYDDPANRQVVFEGFANGRQCRVDIEYDTLEAIGTGFDDTKAMKTFKAQVLRIAELAELAVRAHPGKDHVRITEDDLD